MKIKILVIVSLSAFLSLSACGGKNDNTNVNNANKNTNVTASTPLPTPPPVTASDSQLKTTVENNLKAKNLTGITVDVKDGEVTLRGTVAKDKLPEAMMAANEAKPKKVNNELSVK